MLRNIKSDVMFDDNAQENGDSQITFYFSLGSVVMCVVMLILIESYQTEIIK